MVRAGWLTVGKMVIYPIRDDIDGEGRQLVNWVAEIETPKYRWSATGTGRGRLGDFFAAVRGLALRLARRAALIRATETVLEYPMVDQDPLPRWSFGRVTLLGDAAHPMVPRGSNGAGQAILDARCLADRLLAQRRDAGGAERVRPGAQRGDGQGGADEPQQPARRDPARGARAHRRPAVRADRGRGVARRAGAIAEAYKQVAGLRR